MNGPTVFVALAVASLILGCASSIRPVKLGADSNKVIGHLKWSITDTASGQVIGQGERDVKVGEVKLEVKDSQMGKLSNLQFPLSDHFEFGIASSKDDSQGFGILSMRDDQPAFCWEWFVVSGQTATKLQESGQVALKLDGGQITRVDFLTDVSMRVSPLESGMDPLNPKWRILISKGSTLTIPR